MAAENAAGNMSNMSAATPAVAVLDRDGAAYTLHPYHHAPGSDSYGDEAATALGLDPSRIFKTLIAAVDGQLVCAVVPVAGKLNLKALAGAVGGKKADMADPARAQRATGYVLGGISPLGHKSALTVVVDLSAAELDTMFVSAGKRGLQVELSPEDLLRLTSGRLAEIGTS